MIIYILTKFGADWLIFVDASVKKKIVDGRTDIGRTDGHRRTVSDHNSSLSTPCSGELKTYKSIKNYFKIDIKAISDRLEMLKNIILA